MSTTDSSGYDIYGRRTDLAKWGMTERTVSVSVPSRIGVEQLMKEFPCPEPCHPEDTTQRDGPHYCVGGALVMKARGLKPENAEYRKRFPQDWMIAEALRHLNPLLPAREASYISNQIIENNDGGDLKGAWEWVQRGLGWRRYRFRGENASRVASDD
ncbi:MAG: hypothetical protein ACE5IJ_07685 [Thermoplasmata archaeon]